MAVLAGAGIGNGDAQLSGGASGLGRDFLDPINTVTQDGTAETITLLVNGTPTIKVKQWRINGSDYDFIAQSTLPALSAGLNTDVVLNTQLNVLTGDIISLHLAAEGSGNEVLVQNASPDAIIWTGGSSDFTTNQAQSVFSSSLAFAMNFSLDGTPSSVETITITDIQNANQKDIVTNNKSIAFSGTYTGTPTSLQRRIEYADNNETISDWTTFDATPSGGVFSSSDIINASNRPINILVRFSNDVGVTDTSNNFYIGDFLFIAGESIAEDMGTDGTGTPSNGVFMWDDSTGNLTTPSAGAGQIELANTVIAHTSHAVFIRNMGVGSTRMFQENGSPYLYDPVTNQAQYQAILDAHSAAGGTIPFICLFIGANDAFNAVLPKADVITNYAAFFAKLRTDTQAGLKVLASTTARHLGAVSSDQGWTDNVLAQKQAFDNDSNVFYTSFLDQPLKDDVHPTVAGYEELARRTANAAITEIYGGSAPYRPPTISNVSALSPTQTLFTINRPEGTDISPSINITDIGLSEDGFTSEVTISSVNRTDATSFTATHASATVTDYRENWGASPTITGIIQDNSARTLPIIQSEGSVSALSSTLNLNISGIPDGTYTTVLDQSDGTRVTRQNITYASGQSSIVLSVAVGTTIKGYVDDSNNPSTDGAYIEGVTS